MHGFVPDISRFDNGWHLSASLPNLASVRLDVSVHDSANQAVDFRHLHRTEGGGQMYLGRVCLAGLRLHDGWAAWNWWPFPSQSRSHVSVYEKVGSRCMTDSVEPKSASPTDPS